MGVGDLVILGAILTPIVFLALRLDARDRVPVVTTCELAVDLGRHGTACYTLEPEQWCTGCEHPMHKVDVEHRPDDTFTIRCPYCETIVRPTTVRYVKGGLTLLEFER